MGFKNEAEFEQALINVLIEKGWETEILKNYTEKDLIKNWADILFENNRTIDRLNDCPLTDGEMGQILEQINTFRTPLKLNSFINGKTISIKRDNPNDTLHLGKDVSLKIYDRREISAGQSRYQIVQQPKFASKSKILNDRRGDLMLLINGMPVIHIELKRSGTPLSQASTQIEKYSHEGIFNGLFSLVQIFVAMTPTETVYFANPGVDGKFNSDYYFHWADFNNEPINEWKKVASEFLSIPMAHEVIGFYTVADSSDGVLKVMRSYQYYASNAISDKVSNNDWDKRSQRGGYIWHTTGSGKTMTSFKSAQLIANSKGADKVIFLTDRIELGTQSLKEYNGFADENETVQATENTNVLITKLKSKNTSDTLIVTSIQKMSNIKNEEDGLKSYDIELINQKRIVFIVDEAHRSTFGDMLCTIKETFPCAIFFGFTGTPIDDENKKKMSTTAMIFGDELHRYSIADGIRDKNVLGFDTYKILTYKDRDVRQAVALSKAKAHTVKDALSDEKKAKVFNKFMNSSEVKMAGYRNENGKYKKGIEDYIPRAQYREKEHQRKVVEDIIANWLTLSQNYKFHAMFATSSIPEAIDYYRLFKELNPNLKVTCLFDPNIDNVEGFAYKEDGLVEVMQDYNKLYDKDFTIPTHAQFKKDISFRLAHKEYYKWIEKEPEKQLDLLIVVNQMLTGFDSKWINTLYLDKVIEYENLIQAFSRTNRLFGHEKPFGTIRYYRQPHTMEVNIKKAVKFYSGDRPFGLFVDKLDANIEKMNNIYNDIEYLFTQNGETDFSKLPDEPAEKAKFASLFNEFNKHLESAKIQGFKWDNIEDNKLLVEHFEPTPVNVEDLVNDNVVDDSDLKEESLLNDDLENDDLETQDGEPLVINSLGLENLEINSETSSETSFETIDIEFEKNNFLALAQRYKELSEKSSIDNNDTEKEKNEKATYDLMGYITEIDTGVIDSAYMNSTFKKYLKLINEHSSEEEIEEALNELHKTFATLTQEEQKYAKIFLHDLQRGDVIVTDDMTIRDYITQYLANAKDDEISVFANTFGLDETKLRNLMSLNITDANLNEFGRFDDLKNSVDKQKARDYFEKATGEKLIPPKVNIKMDKLLREFLLSDGFEI